MRGRLLFAAALAVVAAALVVGVLTVGGPLQGQRDTFDRQRYEDLGRLARALLCERYSHGPAGPLPLELTVESLRTHCGSAGIARDDLFDRETGLPYTYDRQSDRAFTLCATFHDAGRAVNLHRDEFYGASFDPETGCASGVIQTP